VVFHDTLRSRHHTGQIDVEALKQAHPIEDVVARYGIELRRQGRSAVGRCPFHGDRGRPNLYLWSETRSWFCFRCGVGGDAIRFVEMAEGIGFRDAIARLGSGHNGQFVRQVLPPTPSLPPAEPIVFDDRDAEELAVLRTATSVYHHRLLTDRRALTYLEERGLDRAALEKCRIGYAAGDELVALLRWQRLPLGPALRVGLLTHAGREFMAGRIVVPELRGGHPVWLVGRLLENGEQAPESDEDPPPKYLALRGSKPLLGAELAREAATVVVVEGVFDLLTLRRWGYPAVALVGTHTRPDVLDELRAFQRVYLVLDQDDAGLEATLRLIETLGPRAVAVALPDGIKDVGDLGPRPDGQAVFAAAMLEAVGAEHRDAQAGCCTPTVLQPITNTHDRS
jgi:DNA primase